MRVVYKLVEKLCQYVAGEEDMMEFIYQSIKAIPRPYEDYHVCPPTPPLPLAPLPFSRLSFTSLPPRSSVLSTLLQIELIRSFAEAATVESPSSSPSRKRDYGLELLADTIVGDDHAGEYT